MKPTILLALPALAAALFLGSPTAVQQAGGLTRVQPRQQAAPPIESESWRERLSQPDLDLREQAFAELVAQAAREPELRREVEAWAREGTGELAWTSRLALRELEGTGVWGRGMLLRPRMQPFGPQAWSADPFDLDQLLERFGMQPGLGMQDLFDAPLFRQQPGAGWQSSESLQLEMGPDGVKAQVTRDVDGESVTEEYEAATLEELLEAHPELRGRLGTQAMPLPRLGFPGAGRSLIAPEPRTDVLGVVVRPLSEEERAGRSPAEGGLFVERVSPGTIAASLGVQHGHVLVELNGRPLRGAEDISAVLAERGEDQGLELRLLDRWGQERTRTWSPAPRSQRALRPPDLRRL